MSQTYGGPQKSKTLPTSKSFLILAFALIIFVIGVFVTTPLIFASIPLVALLGIASLTIQVPHADLLVSRTIEESQIYERESIKVKLEVRNVGKKDSPFIQIRDLVPADLEGNFTQNGFTFSLKQGETKELEYELKARSFGVYNIGPIRVSSDDSLGFFECNAVFDLKSTLLVLPENRGELRTFSARPRHTKPWPGEITSRKTGLGSDYFSTREQIPGESLRRVNWRASARAQNQDKLFLNEYASELASEAMIVVDARQISDVGERHSSTVTYSIRAALEISDRLLKDRNRVGLVTIGANAERVSTGCGRRQYNKIMLALIKLKPGEAWIIENLERYLRFFYPNISQVIFISSLSDDQSLEVASDIARRGYDLVVVSPNPLDFQGIGRKRDSDKTGEALARLYRESNIRSLRSKNVFVVDWHVSEPLGQVIETNARAWRRHFEKRSFHLSR